MVVRLTVYISALMEIQDLSNPDAMRSYTSTPPYQYPAIGTILPHRGPEAANSVLQPGPVALRVGREPGRVRLWAARV